jgi:periplasmic divalent cation tolerance protein
LTDIVSVYAIFGNDQEARRVARQLVEERHAACANVLGPCHSVYRWQGSIEEAAEVPVIFKTRADGADALVERIGRLSSYDVPAVVAWPIAAAPASYRQWVADQTESDADP